MRKKEARCEGVQKATAGGGDTVCIVNNYLRPYLDYHILRQLFPIHRRNLNLHSLNLDCCKCKSIFEGLRKKKSHCEGGDNTVFVVSNAMLIIIKRSYYD